MLVRTKRLSAASAMILCLCCPAARPQARAVPEKDASAIYQRLLPQIEKIPIVDMHAHPGYWDDTDVDAMAVTTTDLDPLRTRTTNPEWLAAFKAMVIRIPIFRQSIFAGSTRRMMSYGNSGARNISRRCSIKWASKFPWPTAWPWTTSRTTRDSALFSSSIRLCSRSTTRI